MFIMFIQMLKNVICCCLYSLKGATNETLLAKFSEHHHCSTYYRVPVTKQSSFTIIHYAGKVKYLIQV